MKVFDWIRNVLFVLAIIVVVAAAACFVLQIKPAIVLSGSMEPTFHTGSVVFVNKKAANDVAVGDAIAFYVADEYVTHRIIDETETTFITKGDGNESPDPWQIAKNGTSEDGPQIDGKCMFSIPILGYVLSFASSKKGIIIIATLILCLIFSMFLVPKEGKEDDSEKLKEELKKQEEIRKDIEEQYERLYQRHMQFLNYFNKQKVIDEKYCEQEAEKYKLVIKEPEQEDQGYLEAVPPSQ